MSDLRLTPLYLNTAGRRLVGLDGLYGVSMLDFFCEADRASLADDFFGRVRRDARAEAKVRFRHFGTGEPRPAVVRPSCSRTPTVRRRGTRSPPSAVPRSGRSAVIALLLDLANDGGCFLLAIGCCNASAGS
jgi:hypothetical protein